MAHAIVLAPEAAHQLRALRAHVRAAVIGAMERHLRHEPTRTSRSRIKRLRGLSQPQFQLRVGDVRVFYDVAGKRVDVLAVITKARAEAWLKEKGAPDEEGGAGEG